MQFGLGKQQSTESRWVGSQFALWQTLRHNQHAFSEAGVGPHIIRNSRSLSLFSVAIWRIRFAEGQLANTAKLAKNATKTYLAGSCRRSRHRPQTAGAAAASAGSMLILMLMLILDMRLRLRCRGNRRLGLGLGIGMQCESCGPIKSGSQ